MSKSSLEKLPIEQVLQKHKLSIDDLVKCGKEGLLATKEGHGYDENGDKVEVPDYHVRHKYFDSFMTLLGYLKPNSISIQNVQISKEESDLIEAYKRTSKGQAV